jgi:bifunctional NMN adenylyltransferase/nudix hydrolase
MKKLAVIIGRFQLAELHLGHRKLVDLVASKSDRLLVIIGSSRAKFTKRNPLDYETRKLMIQVAFPENKYAIGFANALDFKSNQVWSEQIDDLINKELLYIREQTDEDIEVTLYGSRDSFIPHYEGVHNTIELHEVAVDGVSSTLEREIIGRKPMNTPDFRAGVIYATQNMFPKVHPTVDIAIFNEDYSEILLGRKHAETLFRFIGGFTDPTDNSYEMAAKRETCEECGGIEVSDLEYITSRRIDDWRYKSEEDKIMTIMFAGKYIFGHPKGGDDIAEVAWYKINQLVESNLVIEHAKLLVAVKEYQYGKQLRDQVRKNIDITIEEA